LFGWAFFSPGPFLVQTHLAFPLGLSFPENPCILCFFPPADARVLTFFFTHPHFPLLVVSPSESPLANPRFCLGPIFFCPPRVGVGGVVVWGCFFFFFFCWTHPRLINLCFSEKIAPLPQRAEHPELLIYYFTPFPSFPTCENAFRWPPLSPSLY